MFVLRRSSKLLKAALLIVLLANLTITARADTTVYFVSGSGVFHAAGCPLIEGKSVAAISWSMALKMHLAKCAVCNPQLEPEPEKTTEAKKAEADRLAILRNARALAAQSPSLWTGGQTAKSEMDDSQTFAYRLSATAPVQAWLETIRPALIVRCREQEIDAYMVADTAADVEAGGGHTFRIRWDAEPAQTEAWTESTDRDSYFSPSPVDFIKKLSTAQRLRIGFTPFNAAPVVVSFQVKGFGKRLDVIAAACQDAWSAAEN